MQVGSLVKSSGKGVANSASGCWLGLLGLLVACIGWMELPLALAKGMLP